MNRQIAIMEDPTFAPGSTHSATIDITVEPAGMSCTAELWLTANGVAVAATSGAVPFTSTGAEQSINVSVTMPSTSPTNGYAVYLDIVSGGVLIAAYEASEKVGIAGISRVYGRITDESTGLPVSVGVRVTLAGVTVSGDANGQYEINNVASGQYQITIATIVTAYTIATTETFDITVVPGDNECNASVSALIVFPPDAILGRVYGVVIDSSTGLPLRSVIIYLSASGSSWRNDWGTGVSGQYVFEGFPQFAPYGVPLGTGVLRFHLNGYADKTVWITVVPGNNEHNVSLSR